MSLRAFKHFSPHLCDGVYVDPSAVLIGELSIGKDSSIWPLVVARADVNNIHIGARTNIQDGSVLHVTRKSASNPSGNPLSSVGMSL